MARDHINHSRCNMQLTRATIIRPTGTVSSFVSGAQRFDGPDGLCSELFGQHLVGSIAVVAIVSNGFAHALNIHAMSHAIH